MKAKPILTLICIVISINLFAELTPFEYIIKGKVIGQQTGILYLFESGGRIGDEIEIPIQDGEFEFKGISFFVYIGHIAMDDFNYLHELVIEPGKIVLEIHTDSIKEKKFNILHGQRNLEIQKARREHVQFANPLLEKLYSEITPEDLKQQITNSLDRFVKQQIMDNWNNYTGIYYLNRYGTNGLFSEFSKSEFFNNQTDPLLRQSVEFRELTSKWTKNNDSINLLNHKAFNFRLPNYKGEIIEFNDIAKGKVTFVEQSGSWCGNLTNTTRSYKPLYEKYHDYGFEIITFVNEIKYDRWLKWIEKENYPWTNVVELESNDTLYEHMLFDMYMFPANYLVNEEGIIIAKNLSAEALNELLMQKFEPENFLQYQKEKWILPESIHILDKEKSINSLNELSEQLQGKRLFIDCWATWCAPCLEEFKHNEALGQFLKSEDIEIVYINFDDNIDEAKWLNAIKTNNLQGFHLRASASFIKDLAENGYKNLLPTYMIMNEKAEIVEPNAFRPSEKEKLYEQIKSLLNK